MPGSLSHLTRRFFDVLLARPLLDSEQQAVAVWLSEQERSLFLAQPKVDQRHGYMAALTVIADGVVDRIVIKTALLHDIGKRHARLGVIGRVVASLLILLRIPIQGRWAAYRDHGQVAAAELEAIGCAPLIVDFARVHHGERPSTIDPEIWRLLQKADQPPKTRAWNPPGIS